MDKGIAYWLVAVAEAIVVMLVSALLFGIRLQTGPVPLVLGTGHLLSGGCVLWAVYWSPGLAIQNGAVQGTAIAGFLTSFLLSGFNYRLENIPFPLSLLSNLVSCPVLYFADPGRLCPRDRLGRPFGTSPLS